ncbi:AsmA family protein [Teichococcus aestuarii]|uniref:AsmA domain-containing protein n=1 Tax=Teichococcus aestuarii TaxID=568898 RepID=A0A2U1UZR3_9PROT|nr:AsmA family protein [Pseudoroseomonas aestuarii]PWC27137.1 hypothetical protein CR165_19465 [Pseudoroseomonas aestuarii]
MAPPRRRRRTLLAGAAVLVAVPVLAWGGLNLVLRDSVLRPRVIAAVEQATGRALTLSGPVGIKLSLVPTVTLEGVALANAPGGSRAEMLTASRVEARLALLPLLSRRIAFERLTLIEPDLLLEVDAEGQGNWRLSPAPSPATGRPEAAPGGAAEGRLALSIAAVDIEGGRLTWHDARTGRREVLDIRSLALRAETPAAPIDFQGALGLRGVAVALEGHAGPLARLLGTSAEPAAWPLHVALAAPGLQLVADGSATRPEAAAGWQLALKATAESTARLAPFLPRAGLPPLRGLELDAELADAGAGRPPRLDRLVAHTEGGDLGAWVPGLALGAATLRMPGPEQPGQLNADLSLRGLPVQAEGQLPAPAALLGDGPWPLRLTLRGAGATAEAQAELPGPRLEGANVALSLAAPDTAPLLSALGLPGPRLTEARLEGRLLLPAGGAALEGLRLRAREATLEGEARLALGGPRPALTARLNASRVDLDALLAPLPATPAAAPSAAPAPGAAPAAPAVPPRPPAPAATAEGPRRVIPALPLPNLAPRGLDGDIQLAVAELLAQGITYRDLRGTAKLADGRLTVAPLAVTLPGGRLSGRLGAEGTGPAQRLTLALRHEGAGLDLRPLLQAYGLPGQASGRLELEADLSGTGADLRALAGSLGGHLGLALANGQIDNRLLDRLGGDLRRMLVPNAPTEGGTPLRCLALRLNLREGVARPQAMLLETGLADVVGSGRIDLGQETLALRLLPQVRLGGLGLTAPVLVGGTLAAPSYRLDPAGVAEATAGIVGDLVARQMENQDSVLGQLAQQLAGRGNALPDCAQQLAVARGGRSGPVPAPRPASQGQERPASPVDLLRGLLGR